jgi:hypothetical protein
MVTFRLGSGPAAQTCSAPTNASGVATCSIGAVNQPLGSVPIYASFAADQFDQAATATGATVVFSYLASGSFVVGDQSAATGATVTWWGPTWSSANLLSGGTAPASLKGFAVTLSGNPPIPGGTWTTTAGASSTPPASVPSYMAVIVTSSVSKSGSTIFSGSIANIAIVQVAPGYSPATGTRGMGQVLGFLYP